MTTETEILQTIAQMPEPLKQELLHYAKALLESHSTPDALAMQAEEPAKRGGLGIWKGKIWVADDFDAPLEDFKDYM
ncbi:MAG: DUF2281 domain-containing protein [Stenomitos frigidus ULC029]